MGGESFTPYMLWNTLVVIVVRCNKTNYCVIIINGQGFWLFLDILEIPGEILQILFLYSVFLTYLGHMIFLNKVVFQYPS